MGLNIRIMYTYIQACEGFEYILTSQDVLSKMIEKCLHGPTLTKYIFIGFDWKKNRFEFFKMAMPQVEKRFLQKGPTT